MHPIKKFCEEKNLSQKQFAEMAGLHPQEISNFINGLKSPGKIAASKITKASDGTITFRDLRPDLAALVDGNGDSSHV